MKQEAKEIWNTYYANALMPTYEDTEAIAEVIRICANNLEGIKNPSEFLHAVANEIEKL